MNDKFKVGKKIIVKSLTGLFNEDTNHGDEITIGKTYKIKEVDQFDGSLLVTNNHGVDWWIDFCDVEKFKKPKIGDLVQFITDTPAYCVSGVDKISFYEVKNVNKLADGGYDIEITNNNGIFQVVKFADVKIVIQKFKASEKMKSKSISVDDMVSAVKADIPEPSTLFDFCMTVNINGVKTTICLSDKSKSKYEIMDDISKGFAALEAIK